jgi:hypothetical protein
MPIARLAHLAQEMNTKLLSLHVVCNSAKDAQVSNPHERYERWKTWASL